MGVGSTIRMDNESLKRAAHRQHVRADVRRGGPSFSPTPRERSSSQRRRTARQWRATAKDRRAPKKAAPLMHPQRRKPRGCMSRASD